MHSHTCRQGAGCPNYSKGHSSYLAQKMVFNGSCFYMERILLSQIECSQACHNLPKMPRRQQLLKQEKGKTLRTKERTRGWFPPPLFSDAVMAGVHRLLQLMAPSPWQSSQIDSAFRFHPASNEFSAGGLQIFAEGFSQISRHGPHLLQMYLLNAGFG